jgi:hypothetical protein
MSSINKIRNVEEQEIGNFKDEAVKRLAEGYYQQIEGVFLKALQDKGLPSTSEFIRDNIKKVIIEGDEYEHYWYRYGLDDAIRIISIGKPTMQSGQLSDDFINNKYKIVLESKYY